jgi:DNA-binding CsgD family transcriptional regulator/tetratricopeptide (TPR) repeat protein
MGGAQLIGRARQLGVLRDALAAAQAGHGQVVVVEGGRGQGKSALLHELETDAREGGFAVLRAQAAELQSDHPFEVLRHALRDRSLKRPDLPTDDIAAALRERSTDVGQGNRLTDLLIDLVEQAAGAGAALVIIDDAQWLDPASARVVTVLAGAARTQSLVVAVAFTTDDPRDIAARSEIGWPANGWPEHQGDGANRRSIAPALRSGLIAAGARVVAVDSLTRSEIAQLADAELGPGAARTVLPALEIAAGNALVVTELLREFALDPDLLGNVAQPTPFTKHATTPSKAAATSAPLPAVLSRIVHRRLAPMSSAAHDIVWGASLLGPVSQVELVTTALGCSEPDFASAMTVAADIGVAGIENGFVTFRHVLIQRAISEQRTPAEHRQVARAMARRLADRFPAESAELMSRSDDGSRASAEETVRTMLLVADHAIGGSVDVALSWLRRASARADIDPSLRSTVLIRRALMEATSGRADAALRTAVELETLLEGTSERWLAKVAVAATTAIQGATSYSKALELLDEAMTIDELPDAWRADLVSSAAQVALFAGRLAESQQRAGLADASASRSKEVEACVALFEGRAEDALHRAREAVESYGGSKAPLSTGLTVPHTTLATVELVVAGPAEALATCEEGLLACDRAGYRVAQVHLLTVAAWGHLLAGELARAEDDLTESARLRAEADGGIPDPVAAALRAFLAAWRGDRIAAATLLEHAIERCDVHGFSLLRGDVAAWAIAETAAMIGRADLGVDVLRRAWTQLDGQFLSVLSADTYRLAQLVDANFADDIYERTRRRALTSTVSADQLAIRHVEAIRDGDEEAFASVVCRLERSGRMFEANRLRERASSTSRHQSGVVDPQTSEPEASSRLEHEVRNARPTPLDLLSPREAEIARMVASGFTNRQVGGALCLSARTVETHLSNAMRKLGCTSRVQVAALLGPQPAG